MKLRLFDIQRFSVQDGPGIRTSVFLKGCPLRCYWCHNPESAQFEREIMFYPEKCVGCGKCSIVCPEGAHVIEDHIHVYCREKCILCGACISNCPERALEMAGYDIEVQELFRKISRDQIFYTETGGGVTFTGGEPLAQYEGLKEIAKMCAEAGMHTAVETSLLAPQKAVLALDELVSLWICDMKAFSPQLHERGTGSPNEGILESLLYLLRRDPQKVWVRIPFIPNFNDLDDEFAKIANFLSKFHIPRVEIMPYHAVGESKYIALGKKFDGEEAPTEEKIKHFCRILEKGGVANVTF